MSIHPSKLLLQDSVTSKPGVSGATLGTPGEVVTRTDRFLARVDKHLTALSQAKARSFLAQQIAAWEMRYEQFLLSDGKSEPVTDPNDPPQASDFLLTITGLQARRSVSA